MYIFCYIHCVLLSFIEPCPGLVPWHWGHSVIVYPDINFHVAHMGLTWVLSAPGGPHIGPMNLAIRVMLCLTHICNHEAYGINIMLHKQSKCKRLWTVCMIIGTYCKYRESKCSLLQYRFTLSRWLNQLYLGTNTVQNARTKGNARSRESLKEKVFNL